MSRSKLVAIITGVISVFLAVVYLILVQLLDFRGEMIPAPQSQLLPITVAVVQLSAAQQECFDFKPRNLLIG